MILRTKEDGQAALFLDPEEYEKVKALVNMISVGEYEVDKHSHNNSGFTHSVCAEMEEKLAELKKLLGME